MPSLGGTGDEQLLFICMLAGVCVWSAVVVALNILRRRTSIFGGRLAFDVYEVSK